MKITVTQKHIRRGKRGSPSNCPIAIAMNEQCPTYETFVGGFQIFLMPLLGGPKVVTQPTIEAQIFIADFDVGRLTAKSWWQAWKPEEYAFQIAIPEPSRTDAVERTSVSDVTLALCGLI